MALNNKTVLIFHHTDLDGIGVKIIGIKRAQSLGLPYKTFACNYHEINQAVVNALKVFSPKEVAEIIIGDISVNTEVAKMVNAYYKDGVDVTLRDHHLSAEWLNQYPWAYVTEAENDIARCGTHLLAQCYPTIFSDMETFINTVDSWDTWKWKTTNDLAAKDLNSLLKIMGEENFTEYILNLYDNQNQRIVTSYQLFNSEAKLRIEVRNDMIASTARNCENSMWIGDCDIPASVCPVHIETQLKFGVIFCNDNVSNVADYILDRHPELDFLAIMALPKTISFRTQKDNLLMPLNEIAKMFTGSGGGHPQSSGATIQSFQFKSVLKALTTLNSHSKLLIHHLKPAQED